MLILSKHLSLGFLVLVFLGASIPAVAQNFPVGSKASSVLKLWTVEGEDDGALQLILDYADDFKLSTGVEIIVENRDVQTLREDIQNSIQAKIQPDLVWTVSDHFGPFVNSDLILPLDDFFDTRLFMEMALAPAQFPDPSVPKSDKKTWGIPFNFGNHLMLYYHKSMVPYPPRNTDELIVIGKNLTGGKTFGLVHYQNEPFWLFPWYGGFGGSIMDASGVQPTLNNPAMIKTLQFLFDLKFKYKIVPEEMNYNIATSMFQKKDEKTGQYLAAMIINGDWALGTYLSKIPDLGIAKIPMISSTGIWPRPLVSGKYILITKALDQDPIRLDQAIGFIKFITSRESQIKMASELSRLPALKEVFNLSQIVEDTKINKLLKDAARQLDEGIPVPSVSEMRYVWDNVRPFQEAVLSRKLAPEEAARSMQEQIDFAIKFSKRQ